MNPAAARILDQLRTPDRVGRDLALLRTRRYRCSGLTFTQHLNQWVTVRNALAHGSIRRLLRRVNDPARWQDPMIGDPYASVLHGRFRLWESDAPGDSRQPDERRLAGATIQSGCARGCLALVIQVVDWLIVDIGSAHGRAWDVEDLRLPQAWFHRRLPQEFRGDRADRYAHWTQISGKDCASEVKCRASG